MAAAARGAQPETRAAVASIQRQAARRVQRESQALELQEPRWPGLFVRRDVPAAISALKEPPVPDKKVALQQQVVSMEPWVRAAVAVQPGSAARADRMQSEAATAGSAA